jgi:hypothetical protein
VHGSPAKIGSVAARIRTRRSTILMRATADILHDLK